MRHRRLPQGTLSPKCTGQLHSGSGGAGCTPPHLRSLTPQYIHTYASVLDSIMRNSSGSSPIPRKSSNGSATLASFSSISHLSNRCMRLGRRHDRIDIDRHSPGRGREDHEGQTEATSMRSYQSRDDSGSQTPLAKHPTDAPSKLHGRHERIYYER
ncbi:hypothetical protein BD311DRAFT_766666, partial [Dichomitus squalens]